MKINVIIKKKKKKKKLKASIARYEDDRQGWLLTRIIADSEVFRDEWTVKHFGIRRMVPRGKKNSDGHENGWTQKRGKRRFYEHTWKVAASGRPRRVFLRHNWLSRIPGWNAYEDERYKMLRRLLPRQMEKARPKHLRRAYNYAPRLSIALHDPLLFPAGLRLCLRVNF